MLNTRIPQNPKILEFLGFLWPYCLTVDLGLNTIKGIFRACEMSRIEEKNLDLGVGSFVRLPP